MSALFLRGGPVVSSSEFLRAFRFLPEDVRILNSSELSQVASSSSYRSQGTLSCRILNIENGLMSLQGDPFLAKSMKPFVNKKLEGSCKAILSNSSQGVVSIES